MSAPTTGQRKSSAPTSSGGQPAADIATAAILTPDHVLSQYDRADSFIDNDEDQAEDESQINSTQSSRSASLNSTLAEQVQIAQKNLPPPIPPRPKSSTPALRIESNATTVTTTDTSTGVSSSSTASSSAAERDYTLLLKDLDIKYLTPTQRTCIIHLVACVMPSSSTSGVSLVRSVSQEAQASLSPNSPSDSPTTATTQPPKSWEHNYLSLLLTYFQLDSQLINTLIPLVGRSIDPSPFLVQLGATTPILHERMRILLILLHFSLITMERYDARVRALLRSLCVPTILNINWSFFVSQEHEYARLVSNEAQKLESHQRKKKSTASKIAKWSAVGLAGVGAGALLFVTAGLAAAPLAAGVASLGVIGTASTAIFLASTAGTILLASVFGGVGAGLISYKLNRRLGGLQEFQFEKLNGSAKASAALGGTPGNNSSSANKPSSSSKDNKDNAESMTGNMSVLLTINGSLIEIEDYHHVWLSLVPDRHVVSSLDAGNENGGGLTAGQMMRKQKEEEERKKKEQGSSSSSTTAAPPTHSPLSPRSAHFAEFEEQRLLRTRALIDENVLSPTSLATLPLQSHSSAYSVPTLATYADVYTLRWESRALLDFGRGLQSLSAARELAGPAATTALRQTVLAGVISAIAWPVGLLQVASNIDNPWLIVLSRCAPAAIELANALESRLAGKRPITIVAYSFGARVVFLALEELYKRMKQRKKLREKEMMERMMKELQQQQRNGDAPVAPPAKKSLLERMKSRVGSKSSSSSSSKDLAATTAASLQSLHDDSDLHGMILDVYLFGCPIPCDLLRWQRVRSLISGRFVNGYCSRDWLLRFVYPLTNLSKNVAGLMRIRRRGGMRKKYEEMNRKEKEKEMRRQEEWKEEDRKEERRKKREEDKMESSVTTTTSSSLTSYSSHTSLTSNNNASTNSLSSEASTTSTTAGGADSPIDHAADDIDSDEEFVDVGHPDDEEDDEDEEEKQERSANKNAAATISSPTASASRNYTADFSQGNSVRYSAKTLKPSSSSASSFSSSSSFTSSSSAFPLTPTSICYGIESYDLTDYIRTHLDYGYQMELLLKKVDFRE